MNRLDVNGEVMITEEEIAARVKELGKELSALYAEAPKPPILVCILKGSLFFTADLARAMDVDVCLDFMKVSSYGSGTESTGNIVIKKDLDTDIRDRDVVLVEDIIDTGRTLSKLKDMLSAREPRSITICTFLDKPSRRVVDLKPDYFGFQVENHFIVGYGLDFAEKYRGIPYITCLDE